MFCSFYHFYVDHLTIKFLSFIISEMINVHHFQNYDCYFLDVQCD